MTESSPEKIYDKFRSSDNQIAFLMTEQGELSLDREIVKMMKDMRVDEIVQFADSFFSFTENQCQSLRDLVQKQLESRQFEVGGCGGVSKQSQISQNIQIRRTQHTSNKHVKKDNQNKSLVKNLNNLPKILEQLQFALKENDQIGAEPVSQTNNKDTMQQVNKIDFDQFKYQQYKLQIDSDDAYLTELTQATIQPEQTQNLFLPNTEQTKFLHQPQKTQQYQNHEEQQQPPSSIPTTIQQNSQLQFDQLQRINLEENRYRITYNNGDIYEGQLENQMKNGEGEYYYSTGQKYSGCFVDDEINGYGRYYFLSGAEYQGDWSSGMKHGMGILKFANGDQYQGNFVNDLFHGKGTYKYSKGDIFVGNWRSGLKHGKGTFQSIDGNMQIGTWVNDKFQI